MTRRVVEISRSLMCKNDAVAAELRARFAAEGTLAVNLLSSPGAGKTTLLEETLRRLGDRLSVGALVGDQATENDARRLARSGAPVRQITTAAECRLDAAMIASAVRDWDPGRLDILFVENVGNLICPAEYDLGEDVRVVLFPVTEGEDKPLKYPLAFHTAHVVLVTKVDVADAVGFDPAAAESSVRAVNAHAELLPISSRSGLGLDAWIAFLEGRLAAKAPALVRP